MKCTRRILSYCCKNNSNLEEFGTIGLFLSFSFYNRQKEGPPPTFFFSVVPCFVFHTKKQKIGFSPAAPLAAPGPGCGPAGRRGGRGAAERAAVLARSQRARLRLSVVKCEPPGGEGMEGGMSAVLSLPVRLPPSVAGS